MNSGRPGFRYCVEFAKVGPARFLSHLDLQAAFERALRRARLPLAWSEGFQPRPRLQFEEALPLGWSSERERLWVELRRPYPSASAARGLARVLPAGLELLRVYPAPGRPRPARLRVFRVEGIQVGDEAGPFLTDRFPPPAAGAPPPVELEVEGAALRVTLRPGRGGNLPALRRVLEALVGEEAAGSARVRRLAVVEEDRR
ncbi:MAG: DUF2344 domain-containing protein [Planctomycetota bacterium]|nr:MAG: DUF2344 domain-containing protein [Planctomycetota bacterium]